MILIDVFISAVCGGKTNETPKAYRGKLARLESWLGDKKFETLTLADLEAFQLSLQTQNKKLIGKKEVRGHLSPHTIRTVLVTVRHFLRWCHEHGHLQEDITRRWKIAKAPKAEPKALAQDTFERLVATAVKTGQPWEQARNLAILYILRDTGGRIGALEAAELEDIDWVQATIWSRSKGSQYPLFLNPPSVCMLRAWLRLRHQAGPVDYKIFTGDKGSGLTRSGFEHMLNRLAEVGQIDGRHNPHSFRHAFARDSLQAGADLSHVSQLMVHSSIVVTADYYVRWNNKELREIHNRTSPGRDLPTP
jgi:site-specific recombinase XerD